MRAKPEPSPDDVHTGAIIRALRQSRGLSPAELAGLIGKSEPLVTAIERGQRRATPQVCEGLAEALRVPLAAITKPEPVQDAEPAQERETAA